jgi:hypothetical protein
MADPGISKREGAVEDMGSDDCFEDNVVRGLALDGGLGGNSRKLRNSYK